MENLLLAVAGEIEIRKWCCAPDLSSTGHDEALHDILRLAAMEFRKVDIDPAFDLKRIQVLSHLEREIVSAVGMGGSASVNMGEVGGN